MRLPCLLLLSAAPLAAATVEGVITYQRAPSAGALAWVPGVTRAAASAAPVIDQKDKVFTPAVLAVRPGATITLRNSDSIQHNAYASDKAAEVTLDTGLNAPASETPIKVDWTAGKVVRFGCKIHPSMQVWIAALDTDAWAVPVAAEAEKTVRFTIADVPADAARVAVWTSKYGQVEIDHASGTGSGQLGPADKPAATITATRRP